jgi:hypothetical protein
MAVEAKYTAPLQVVEEQEFRDRISAVADAEKISQAQVIRDLVRYGIQAREAQSRENFPERWSE